MKIPASNYTHVQAVCRYQVPDRRSGKAWTARCVKIGGKDLARAGITGGVVVEVLQGAIVIRPADSPIRLSSNSSTNVHDFRSADASNHDEHKG